MCGAFNSQRSHFLGTLNRMNVLGHSHTAVAEYLILSNKWEVEAHSLTVPEDENSKVEHQHLRRVFLLHSLKERNTVFSHGKIMQRERMRQEFSHDLNFPSLCYIRNMCFGGRESKNSNHSNEKCYIISYIIEHHSTLRKVVCFVLIIVCPKPGNQLSRIL